jgi:DNA-directed RNA polymerase II subunit RPB2
MDNLETKNIDWSIIDAFFSSNKYYFTNPQIESFNDFVGNKLPYTIKTLNPFTMLKKNQDTNDLMYEVNVYIGGKEGDKIYLGKPILHENKKNKPLYPNEAKLKDLNYCSDLYADIYIEYISHKDNKITNKEFNNTKIGLIPIMVHSNLCILNNQLSTILTEMGECPYDQGGYFIISGKEKVIISQERIATNKLFISKSKEHFSYEAYIRCTSQDNVLFPKTIKFGIYDDDNARSNAIVITCPNIDKQIPLFIMFRALGIESDKEILSYILYDIEAISPKNKNTPKYNSIKKFIDVLRYSIVESNDIYNQHQALQYLSQYTTYKNIDNIKYIIANDFLPNVGKDFNNKAFFLGYLINTLVKAKLGIIGETNKDNYLYKRVDLAGYQLSNLFRDFYNKLRNNIKNIMDREYNYGYWKNSGDISNLINENNSKRIFDAKIITEGMIKSLKGNWGMLNDPNKMGIVQDLNRLSYLGYLSHTRRINTPIDRSIKLLEPHRLNGAQFGSMCPVESPDGGNIGLLKHFPIMTIVSYDIEIDDILECLIDNNMILLKDIAPIDVVKSTKIFINSNWLGIHFEPKYIYDLLLNLRRIGVFDKTISISWYIQEHEIHILTDSGRVLRPLYISNDNELLLDKSSILPKIKKSEFEWKDLIDKKNNFITKYSKELLRKFAKNDKTEKDDITKNLHKLYVDFNKFKKHINLIEYIDIEETNNCLIAMNRSYLENKLYHYTHCELDPSTILSVYSNVIPFSDHNPYPRNAFGAQQGKQAIGVYATNFNNRIDTASYIIHYPQRALVHTKYTKYTHNEELPNGENLIVAIATYTGFNQEDSIIVNKSSIQRGMFNITKFKSFIDEETINKNDNEKTIFQSPIELVNSGTPMKFKLANWEHIDENGLPKVNSYINEEDILLGKVKIIDNEQENENIFSKKILKRDYIDSSIVGDKTKKGFIDKVFLYKNEKNLNKIKMRFRKTMIPELGDKMSSRAGQKGVCGMIYAQEDMPFNKDGIVPDIIINPHAIPSRMTIGHLIECVLCKLGCKYAVSVDGTTFNNQRTKKLFNLLDKKDIHKYGDEIMYNGFTGEQMPCHIFFGPTYYYRLKHIVSDKVNYRNNDGPITAVTKQPTKGRANGGGLRIGEMETNAILGHGISSFLKESMMERSDKFNYSIENENGTIAINTRNNILSTFKDSDNLDFSNIETPYSLKLLLQEIEAFSIKTSLYNNTDNETDDNIENSLLINHEDIIDNIEF